MRERIPKFPTCSVLQIQLDNKQANSQSELFIPQSSTPTSELQQIIPAANTMTQKNVPLIEIVVVRRTIVLKIPPWTPRLQHLLKNRAVQETSKIISPQTSLCLKRYRPLPISFQISCNWRRIANRPEVDQRLPTLEEDVRSMRVFDAKNQESYD